MRINEVENKEVNVTLNADELVLLGNIMYFYENNLKKVEPENKGPNAKFHELNAAVIIARDLCQYGNLDSFSLRHIVQHKLAANPEGELKQLGRLFVTEGAENGSPAGEEEKA